MMADGHLNKGKECTKLDVRKNRGEKSEYYRAYDRVRFYEHGARGARRPESARRAHKNWKARNTEKRSAHTAVGNAIRDGRLKRPGRCEACKMTKFVQGHHDDYSKPLDVRWLCTACHADHHRKNDMEGSMATMEEQVKRGLVVPKKFRFG